jgi:hypothetical protein
MCAGTCICGLYAAGSRHLKAAGTRNLGDAVFVLCNIHATTTVLHWA